jgi:hypothetical protein
MKEDKRRVVGSYGGEVGKQHVSTHERREQFVTMSWVFGLEPRFQPFWIESKLNRTKSILLTI